MSGVRYVLANFLTGQIITEVPVAKHQSIVIGIEAANRDPAIWGSDSNEWNPDRWLKSDTDLQRLPGIFSGMYVHARLTA